MEKRGGLPFDHQEYAARFERAKTEVARRGLDVMLVTIPENIYYLTGHDTLGYFAFQVVGIPREGPPFMFVREIEADHILGMNVIKDIMMYGDREDAVRAFAELMKRKNLRPGRAGIEKDAWFQPVGRVDKLQTLLGGETFADGTGLVESLRVLKSDREIEYIRAAAKAADEGMRAALSTIRVGVPEAEIAAAIYRGLLHAGSDYVGPVYVMSGENSALAHSPWTSRRIQAGDVVYVELAGCVHRYHAAIRRTFSVGPPAADLRTAHGACEASRHRILELLRPGAISQDLHNHHDEVLARAGLKDFLRMKTGYSIGVGYPPGWGEWHIYDLKADDTRPVQARMSLHVGTQLVFRGRYGIGLSDTVIVRDAAPQTLTSLEPTLFEV
jgi:Xaa-Pro dipeptidase